MKTPPIPHNESKRLRAVKQLKLLDTLPEKSYDTITRLAATICQTPISLVTLLDADRNFLKSHLGVDLSESPRDISFCGHAIAQDSPLFIVEDARKDDRFVDNPLVTEFNAIFYAGAPLIDADGNALGTLCIYDNKPRVLTPTQKQSILDLASQVLELFKAHKRNLLLENTQKEILLRNERLNSFSSIVAHDIKSPLATIQGLLNLIYDEFKGDLPKDLSQYLGYIESSTVSLDNYIKGLIAYYKSDELLHFSKEDIELNDLIKEVRNLHALHASHILIENNIPLKAISKNALLQVLTNLVDNGIKYNKSENPKIVISGKESVDSYIITITDNGMGIPEQDLDKVFELFKTGNTPDTHGNMGSGIGLASVKKLVNQMQGEIKVESTLGLGTTFKLLFPKL